jgi:hypothetical protein
MPDFQSSTVRAIRELHGRFPQTPFLTLGQTVLWDEPAKAAFCRICEEVAPTAEIVAGVHDTDYFAKLPSLQSRHEKFALLPHNDGATRGLWSAAGELSSLFGAEIVPTRHTLSENGVAFDRVAKSFPGGATELLEHETAAWGWRALVHTEARPLIAADVKLRDIAPALREQMQWGIGESLAIIGEQAPENIASQLLQWTNEYSISHPDATLSDLYQFLTPKIWASVRGEGNCNLQTTSSLQLFKFNRATCQKPRFGFVDLFLQAATRDTARRCYNDAVRGSGIYQLSQFGEGALPFDVVIPGKGRGTLRLHEQSLYIETEEPITLCRGCDCSSVEELADALESTFGPDVAIVGKAVALISMLSAEYIFVFHEKASSYTSRTQIMNDCLRQAGIALELHPMLRIEYSTWDSLKDVQASFHLPPHLARAFGAEDISAPNFASLWKTVCDEQDALRAQLKACASPRDLTRFLAARDSERWSNRAIEYSNARESLHQLRDATHTIENEIAALRDAARAATERAAQIERDKGGHWRSQIQPLRMRLFDIKENAAKRLETTTRLSKDERRALAETEKAEELEIADLCLQIEEHGEPRAALTQEIEDLRLTARECRRQAREKTRQRVALEQNEETRTLRTTLSQLEYDSELERLHLVRDALLVSGGLRYTNLRPTAWWLPLVSPDGTWFKALAQSAQARIEAL